MKYRIKERDGWFTPQFRMVGIWFSPKDGWGDSARFSTIVGAKDWIDEDISYQARRLRRKKAKTTYHKYP